MKVLTLKHGKNIAIIHPKSIFQIWLLTFEQFSQIPFTLLFNFLHHLSVMCLLKANQRTFHIMYLTGSLKPTNWLRKTENTKYSYELANEWSLSFLDFQFVSPVWTWGKIPPGIPTFLPMEGIHQTKATHWCAKISRLDFLLPFEQSGPSPARPKILNQIHRALVPDSCCILNVGYS